MQKKINWINAVRGVVVVLVVLMHVNAYTYLSLNEVQETFSRDFWNFIDNSAKAIRMPALLFISGMLASTKIFQGFFSKKTIKYLISNAYLYVLWFAIYAGLGIYLGVLEMAQVPSLENIYRELLLPNTTLWFLVGLLVYTSIALVLRKLPKTLVIAVSIIISYLGTMNYDSGELWTKILSYTVYFILGVYLKDLVIESKSRPFLGFTLLASSISAAHLLGDSYLATLSIGIVGVAGLFKVLQYLSEAFPTLTKPLEYIGERTISLYVVHFPLLMVLANTKTGEPLEAVKQALLATSGGQFLYPILATAVIILLSLASYKLAFLTKQSWLFKLPEEPWSLTVRFVISLVRENKGDSAKALATTKD